MKADIKKRDAVIHSTTAGKLYIRPSDFFAQEKIKKMLQRLLESSISKKIEQHSAG
jgi:hypothetical protein